LELAKKNNLPHESIFDKEMLGALIGKGLRSVVLVETCGLMGMISGEVSRFRNFLEGGMEAR
jgi:ribosomal protein L7Ae-like RNA K-turn-binding protein